LNEKTRQLIYEKALEVILNGFEQTIREAREQLKQLEETWDPFKIEWEKREGKKGKYQYAKPQPEKLDYVRLFDDLLQHKGFLEKDGWRYWLFKGSGIGRKQKVIKNNEKSG